MTITIQRVDARAIGTLIALFERAVGFYASLIHINAYHQPGVEAGKKAASAVLQLQTRVLNALSTAPRPAEAIASAAGDAGAAETVYLILEQLAADGRVRTVQAGGPETATFSRV
jgi:glucose-6-phosphate isomerase